MSSTGRRLLLLTLLLLIALTPSAIFAGDDECGCEVMGGGCKCTGECTEQRDSGGCVTVCGSCTGVCIP
jgi:hypothetical protein